MKKSALLLLSVLLAASSSAQSLLLGRNLFPEGTFELFGESRIYPSGWRFPNPDDRPWQAGFRADCVKNTTNGRELRIINPEFGLCGAAATLPLPPKIDRLRVSFRLLPKVIEVGPADPAGNGAGLYARFYDKDAKSVMGGWVGIGPIKVTSQEWQEWESVFTVPSTTVSLELQVVFRGAKGEVRIDDVEVVPVAMSE